MEENVVLGVFAALPLLFGWGLLLFFRKHRLHKRGGTPLLLAGNTLVFTFLCSIVLLFGEIYYRFVYDSTESFGLTKTTARWFQEHFQRNSLGLRDSVDYELKIRNGTPRVTFIGDSFTAGHGIPNVEDRFANRLRGLSPSREVHVLAICGWDTGQEISSLQAACDNGYELESVVLAYCLNDISDISPEWQNLVGRIEGFSEPGALVENSYLCNTLYYRWKAASDPDISDYYQFVDGLYRGRTWEMQKRRLQFLRDEVHRRGGRLLVVTFPFYHALDGNYRYGSIHELLDRSWQEIGVPHLDLLPAYGSYKADELTVSDYDAHPNEHAHSIAAKAIAGFLEQQTPP
ncbi:MAG: hypothetical protein CMJ48_10505 [Planctomycetaceae bacterium]|nr:hypothetical protein [Planctomycetaceae bacterium]